MCRSSPPHAPRPPLTQKQQLSSSWHQPHLLMELALAAGPIEIPPIAADAHLILTTSNQRKVAAAGVVHLSDSAPRRTVMYDPHRTHHRALPEDGAPQAAK